MQMIERAPGHCYLFALDPGAFRIRHVFSNFACTRRACVNPPNAWFSAPVVGSKLFFQNVDL